MNIEDIKIGDTLGYSNSWKEKEDIVTVISICNEDTVLVEYDNEGLDYVNSSDLYTLESKEVK